MITLSCPWCGPRNISEFAYGGELKTRPDPSAVTREAWRRYLYESRNPAGPIVETWLHRAGCRQFLVVERDSGSNAVLSVRRPSGSAGADMESEA